MPTIKNLAFKGGGVLGIAYGGAIKVLEDKNILAGVEKVAGTSAGAITAALVSLNYSSDEITKVLKATNFSSFEDRPDPLRIPFTYGYYAGDALFQFVQDRLTEKGLAANATFSDMKGNGHKDLHVFASDLNTQSIQEFSFDTTPGAIVAEAIRASMSIPVFFKAWKFSNNLPDDHIYVDGGVLYNYPLTAFDTDAGLNPETLGFYLSDLNNVAKPNNLGFDQMGDYMKCLFETMLNAQEIDFNRDPELEDRTVKIDDFGISATDFNLTSEQQDALYTSGFNYTNDFFNKHP
jgi:NTE family protein